MVRLEIAAALGSGNMAAVGKVLVVGGSMAGMSCAIQMRKAGIAVDLVEIDPTWKAVGAGITITGPTLRALKTVGVLPEVLAAGATWNSMKVHDKAGTLLEEAPLHALGPDLPTTGAILRPLLHKILAAKTTASGVNVRLGLSVTQLAEHPDHVDVTFSDGTQGRYDLVVGADGIFSTTREMIFPGAAKPRFTGQVIYRLLAERPEGMDRTYFFMGGDYKVGFNPVSATHMYMYLLHPAPNNPWIDAQGSAAAPVRGDGRLRRLRTADPRDRAHHQCPHRQLPAPGGAAAACPLVPGPCRADRRRGALHHAALGFRRRHGHRGWHRLDRGNSVAAHACRRAREIHGAPLRALPPGHREFGEARRHRNEPRLDRRTHAPHGRSVERLRQPI
jgi:hypothetical protein